LDGSASRARARPLRISPRHYRSGATRRRSDPLRRLPGGTAMNGPHSVRKILPLFLLASAFLVSGVACDSRRDDRAGHDHTDHDHNDHEPGASGQGHDDFGHDDHDHEEHSDHADPTHGEPGHDAHGGGHRARVVLSPAAVAGGGIETAPAGPRTMHIGLDLPGEVVLNADRLAHVVPRFPGIAKEVKKALGDRVSADEVLAVIESNESLARYDVRSMISGVVTEK